MRNYELEWVNDRNSKIPPYIGMKRSIMGRMHSLHSKVSRQECGGLGLSLLHSSSHQSTVKKKIEVQYSIGSEIYTP